MCGIYLLVATAAMGIDFGWELDEKGNVEYMVRLDAQSIDALKSGSDLFSDLPPALRKVRSYRLTTNPARLPNQGKLPVEKPVETEKPSIPAAVTAARPAPIAESPVMPADHQATMPQPTMPQQPIAASSIAAPSEGPILGAATGSMETPAKPTTRLREPDLLADNRRASDSISVPIPRFAHEDNGSPSDAIPPGFDPNGQTPSQPWWPLTLCLLGLFASLGGNLFLGWITADQRGKYRDLVQRLRLAGAKGTFNE